MPESRLIEGIDSWAKLPPVPDGAHEIKLDAQSRLRIAELDGNVAVVVYRLRRPDEFGPPVARFANRRGSLEMAIRAVFDDASLPQTADKVSWYIRSMSWGEKLP